MVEVASVAAWAFLEDAHRVGVLQDLYTERVLPSANQLHGLLNHCQFSQAQPGSSLCANVKDCLMPSSVLWIISSSLSSSEVSVPSSFTTGDRI